LSKVEFWCGFDVGSSATAAVAAHLFFVLLCQGCVFELLQCAEFPVVGHDGKGSNVDNTVKDIECYTQKAAGGQHQAITAISNSTAHNHFLNPLQTKPMHAHAVVQRVRISAAKLPAAALCTTLT
jgi:hypothetical protein